MVEKLKRCPFCGGKASEPEGLTVGGYWIKCTDCGIEQHRAYMTFEEAAAAWNTRADLRPKGRWRRSSPQSDCTDFEANVWQCSVCGNEWQLMDGTPEQNRMNYCQQCGAEMNSEEHLHYWQRHDDSDTWECPSCHACVDLDSGNPKDKYLNFCPVCGTKLELPE